MAGEDLGAVRKHALGNHWDPTANAGAGDWAKNQGNGTHPGVFLVDQNGNPLLGKKADAESLPVTLSNETLAAILGDPAATLALVKALLEEQATRDQLLGAGSNATSIHALLQGLQGPNSNSLSDLYAALRAAGWERIKKVDGLEFRDTGSASLGTLTKGEAAGYSDLGVLVVTGQYALNGDPGYDLPFNVSLSTIYGGRIITPPLTMAAGNYQGLLFQTIPGDGINNIAITYAPSIATWRGFVENDADVFLSVAAAMITSFPTTGTASTTFFGKR